MFQRTDSRIVTTAEALLRNEADTKRFLGTPARSTFSLLRLRPFVFHEPPNQGGSSSVRVVEHILRGIDVKTPASDMSRLYEGVQERWNGLTANGQRDAQQTHSVSLQNLRDEVSSQTAYQVSTPGQAQTAPNTCARYRFAFEGALMHIDVFTSPNMLLLQNQMEVQQMVRSIATRLNEIQRMDAATSPTVRRIVTSLQNASAALGFYHAASVLPTRGDVRTGGRHRARAVRFTCEYVDPANQVNQALPHLVTLSLSDLIPAEYIHNGVTLRFDPPETEHVALFEQCEPSDTANSVWIALTNPILLSSLFWTIAHGYDAVLPQPLQRSSSEIRWVDARALEKLMQNGRQSLTETLGRCQATLPLACALKAINSWLKPYLKPMVLYSASKSEQDNYNSLYLGTQTTFTPDALRIDTGGGEFFFATLSMGLLRKNSTLTFKAFKVRSSNGHYNVRMYFDLDVFDHGLHTQLFATHTDGPSAAYAAHEVVYKYPEAYSCTVACGIGTSFNLQSGVSQPRSAPKSRKGKGKTRQPAPRSQAATQISLMSQETKFFYKPSGSAADPYPFGTDEPSTVSSVLGVRSRDAGDAATSSQNEDGRLLLQSTYTPSCVSADTREMKAIPLIGGIVNELSVGSMGETAEHRTETDALYIPFPTKTLLISAIKEKISVMRRENGQSLNVIGAAAMLRLLGDSVSDGFIAEAVREAFDTLDGPAEDDDEESDEDESRGPRQRTGRSPFDPIDREFVHRTTTEVSMLSL